MLLEQHLQNSQASQTSLSASLPGAAGGKEEGLGSWTHGGGGPGSWHT